MSVPSKNTHEHPANNPDALFVWVLWMSGRRTCSRGAINWNLWGERDSFAADVYSSYANSLSLRSWLFSPSRIQLSE